MTNPAMEAVKAEVRRSSTAVFAYISEFETHDLHSMKIFIDGELASRLVPALVKALDWQEEMCECGHNKNWHSLRSGVWMPASSGCLAGCKCKRFRLVPPPLTEGDRWVEIKEGCRMPEEDQEILYVISGPEYSDPVVKKGLRTYDGNYWWWSDEKGEYSEEGNDPDCSFVTHWQPVPAPPEGDK